MLFPGLAPTLAAVYQINVKVPASVPGGNTVPLVVEVTDPETGARYRSTRVTVAVQ